MPRQHKPVTITAPKPPPRQLALAFEAPQLWMMQAQERQRVVVRLASPPDASGRRRPGRGGQR